MSDRYPEHSHCATCRCTIVVTWTADDPPIAVADLTRCRCAGHTHRDPA